jgi:hypothetical protein
VSDVSALIEERETTHGPFSSNAVAFDRLLKALPLDGFDPRERCAVAMIYMKLARLYSGKMRREHWEDIEGYARLVVELIDTVPQ